jgi:hypothetical protein
MGKVIRITDIERGRMEFREKLGLSHLIFYSFLLLWSVFILSLNFASPVINEWDPLKFFGILGLFGLLAISSFLALFRRRSLIIDRLNGKVTHITRLLWRKHHQDADLSEFDCVSIVKKYSIVKGEHSPFYVIALSAAEESWVLDTKDDYNSARKFATDIAGFVELDLADYSTGQCIARQPDMLNTSIQQRAPSIRQQVSQVKKPKDLRAGYRTEDGRLVVDIPASGMTYKDWFSIFIFYIISSLCLLLGIYLIVDSFRRGTDTPASILFVVDVIILWIVATTTIRVIRFLKSAYQKTNITATCEGLEAKRQGLFRRKKITIPAEELQEIEVIEQQSSFRRSLFSVVPTKSEVIVRSDVATIYFGGGLSIPELRWIHAEICKTLLK